MKRKFFLRNGLLAAAWLSQKGKASVFLDNHIEELQDFKPNKSKLLGFNHIPNTEKENHMDYIIHRADTRGHANHGWLDTHHSFSFASYYNPERMNFGVLRVLNDDRVAAGMGFGTHPHDNMEIISIPLEGDLEHKDSMGNIAVIKNGDIQVLSAGSGITHSEYNRNKNQEVRFLQIWVYPNQGNVKPRYDQITLNRSDRKNKLQQILSPNPEDEGVWIHQDAWFYLSDLEKGSSILHSPKRSLNGVYIFVLNGELKVNNETIGKRDGMGIRKLTGELKIEAISNAEFLLMDVPMQLS
jgi:redox-sensitive bicupin YhaK (pirin superfamily)